MKKIILTLLILLSLTLSGCSKFDKKIYTCQLDMIGSGDQTIHNVIGWYVLDDYMKFQLKDGEFIYLKHEVINALICEEEIIEEE